MVCSGWRRSRVELGQRGCLRTEGGVLPWGGHLRAGARMGGEGTRWKFHLGREASLHRPWVVRVLCLDCTPTSSLQPIPTPPRLLSDARHSGLCMTFQGFQDWDGHLSTQIAAIVLFFGHAPMVSTSWSSTPDVYDERLFPTHSISLGNHSDLFYHSQALFLIKLQDVVLVMWPTNCTPSCQTRAREL